MLFTNKELNLDSVQETLLDQHKVVFRRQIFPIWIDSVCIYVRTLDFESPSSSTSVDFHIINSTTRVIVEPFTSAATGEINPQQSSTTMPPTEWAVCCPQVDTSDACDLSACSSSSRCPRLTTLELRTSDETDVARYGQKTTHFHYLVRVQALKSPMQTVSMSSSSSSNTPMLKFLQSVDSSYPSDFFQHQRDTAEASAVDARATNEDVYALLVVNDVDVLHQLRRGDAQRTLLVMSSLMHSRLLRLVEHISAKVLLITECYLPLGGEELVSTCSRRLIKLRTNYDKNVSKQLVPTLKMM